MHKYLKKMLLFASIIAISSFFKIDVLALDSKCTQAEQLRLRQLAAATDITYEFYTDKDQGENFRGYKVNISNFSPEFYIYEPNTGVYFEYDGDSISTAPGLVGGTYNLPFYAKKGSVCSGYLILTKILDLVPYNLYSEDPLCVGYEKFELCKKFTSINVSSYSEFKARLKAYIKSLDKDEEDNPTEKPTEEEKTLWDNIMTFLSNTYMIFLVAIIVLGTAGIIVIEVKKRRSIL